MDNLDIELNKLSIPFKQEKEDKSTRYIYTSDSVTLAVHDNKPISLGVKLDVLNDRKKSEFTYEIDNDLYNLSNPKFEKIGKQIEEDIIDFLKALDKGEIKVGKIDNRKALLIPYGDKYHLQIKGLFFTRTRVLESTEVEKIKGMLAPLLLK